MSTTPMSIQAVIDTLSKVPESKRHLPLYVWDDWYGNQGISSITPYALDDGHSEDNELSINIIERGDA